MGGIEKEFIILPMAFAFVFGLLAFIFRFVKTEEARKIGLKLEIEREKTHREIAAHVAAGALSVEDAGALIRAMWQADEATIDRSRRTLASLPEADVAHAPPSPGAVIEPA